MAEIPQIDNGKAPRAMLNVVHIPWLPAETPYGNLTLKAMNMVLRLDRINLEVARVFTSYVHPKDHNHLDPKQDLLEHQFYAEQVVYWLRKTADELIALAYAIGEWKTTGSWPSQIVVDSIAGLRRNAPAHITTLFSAHQSFLFTLNEVANAFKHSFINTDMTIVGAEYPVVYALALDRNRLSNEPRFYAVSFADLVTGFSRLYLPTMQIIQAWAREAAESNKEKPDTSTYPPRRQPPTLS